MWVIPNESVLELHYYFISFCIFFTVDCNIFSVKFTLFSVHVDCSSYIVNSPRKGLIWLASRSCLYTHIVNLIYFQEMNVG